MATWQREWDRTLALARGLRSDGLEEKFGFVESLGSRDGFKGDAHTVIDTVRRFHQGQSLHEAVRQANRAGRIDLLSSAARFLGWMNRVERATKRDGSRKDLKAKEVGRWLRTFALDDALGAFDVWWKCVDKVELLARRDAHLWNWLVTPTNGILALDLEATGWRPIGYDLAQITEDHTFLAPSDWEARREIFNQYVDELGYNEGVEAEWASYEACVLARNLRKLTPPTGFGETLSHARDCLSQLAKTASTLEVRGLATLILASWHASRGLTIDASHRSDMTEARRQQLSRTMAYHLRHDLSLETDDGGWADLGALAGAISSVTESDLATVASDLREKRYELQSGRIRARYGHTRPIRIEYAPPPMPVRLFHAAPASAVARIVEGGEGLRRMTRQWVHLSSNPASAMAAGRRYGEPILLTIRSDSVVGVLFAAGDTYLAEAVPARAIGIAPAFGIGATP